MRVLVSPCSSELTVQKSRFLALLEPVTTPEQARQRLKEAKDHYEATHVVHAFRTGPEGSETWGCSDDGEPPGTAGRPVLDVLKGAGGQALLLVVRWFGGTKLGTGGLVKAYGEAAKAVVSAAVWEEWQIWLTATIAIDWSEQRPLHNLIEAVGGQVLAEEFGSGVTLRVRVPTEGFEALQLRTRDLTRGRCRWTLLES